MRADDSTVLTCFLEYEPETVKVHDLVYRRVRGEWTFRKSFYRKLRLAQAWVEEELRKVGFALAEKGVERGFVTLIATR